MFDVAHTKAYSGLKNQKVNLSVAFAERHETSRLFSESAKHIAKQVSAYKGTNPRDWARVVGAQAKRGVRNFPRSWLEMAYGWKPLMSDIQGSAIALSQRERSNDAYRVSVKGTVHDKQKYWLFTCQLVNGINDLAVLNMFLVRQTDVTCKLWYVLDNPVLATFASLGLTNPAELVWERVPYSFVVDWFVPVGGWLSTLDADFGWRFVTGYDTEFSRWTSGHKLVKNDGLSGFHLETCNIQDWKFEGYHFVRGVHSVAPGVGVPHFKNPFSSAHISNALALLHEAFRR
jgi:hypothetical protein